jgi:hypothetical protein
MSDCVEDLVLPLQLLCLSGEFSVRLLWWLSRHTVASCVTLMPLLRNHESTAH